MEECEDKDVQYCCRRAEDFRRLAAQEPDSELKKEWLELEARWLKLAVAYEFPDRINEYSASMACAEDTAKKAG